MLTMGLAYHELGIYGRAEPLLENALEVRRGLWGEQHPEVAFTLNALASVYNRQARHDEAAALYQDALQIWRTTAAGEDP